MQRGCSAMLAAGAGLLIAVAAHGDPPVRTRPPAGLQPASAGDKPSGALMVGQPSLSVTPVQTKAGVSFAVASLNMSANVDFMGDSASGRVRTVNQLRVSGRFMTQAEAVAVYPWRLVVTKVMDDGERDLVDRRRADDNADTRTRYNLVQHFCNSAMNGGREPYAVVQDSVRGLRALPARLMSIQGRAEAVVGARVVRKPIDLKVMDEPVEIAPGVTLLVTEVTATDRRRVLDFEVRTKRIREGKDGSGLEPVFVGLALKDDRGQLLQMLRSGQEVETRDEYLLIAKDQGVSKEYLERARLVEAVVVDGLEIVSFDFEIGNVVMAGTAD